jgi:hypothetical protein
MKHKRKMAMLVFDSARKGLPGKWYCENAAEKRSRKGGDSVKDNNILATNCTYEH